MELLLPAGKREHIYAAFEYGGDACYLGVGSFNARTGAENFSIDDYRKFLFYGRKKNRKLYLTFNTLLKNSEIKNVFSILEEIYDLNPDGVIVQDMGLASLIKREFPKIPLISSTQLGIHNVSGVKFAEDFGFKRVILSRELTIKEIEAIKRNTSIEIEVFIHGAMCYSYSGFCFASSFIGGHSGNRGKCSQVCRMFFEGDLKGYIFNLKDLAGFDYVKTLYEIGVDSLKVEGRLKDELYVAVNTFVYRQFIDEAKGKKKLKAEEKYYLKKLSKIVFSRKRWKGYFDTDHPTNIIDSSYPGNYGLFLGKIEKVTSKCFVVNRLSFPVSKHDGLIVFRDGKPIPVKVSGIKNRQIFIKPVEKFKKGDAVYLVHSVKVHNSFPVKEVKVSQAKPLIELEIDISNGEIEVTGRNTVRDVETLLCKNILTEKPEKRALTSLEVSEEFKKSGNFSFEVKIKSIKISEDFFIPRRELSAARKEIYKQLENKLFPKRSYSSTDCYSFKRVFEKVIVVDEENAAAVFPLLDSFDEKTAVFIKSFNLNRFLSFKEKNITVGFVLPTIVKTYEEEKLKKFISVLVEHGIKDFFVPNIYGISLLVNFNVNMYGDYTFYCMNKETVNFFINQNFKSFTFSIEDDLENLSDLEYLNGMVLIYQDTPLFYSQICNKRVFKGCPSNFKECDCNISIFKKGKKIDRFFLNFADCRTLMIWDRPFNLTKFRNRIRGVFRFDFVNRTYSSFRMEKIIELKIEQGHSANFVRGLK